MVSAEILHETFSSLLYPFGEKYRQAELELNQLSGQPEFVTHLLELILNGSVDLGVRRVSAVYLKNKINRSWSPKSVDSLNDSDRYMFKKHLVTAIALCHPSLRDFLVVCLSKILDFDFQDGRWPELIPEVSNILQNTDNLAGIAAGLRVLKQICKFYRWNLVKVNKQLDPLFKDVYPQLLSIAEAATAAVSSASGVADNAVYYELIYEFLKIYKLSTARFLPEIIRQESFAQRTISLFLQIFTLPLPDAVLSVQPASERYSLLPVKCQKWATGNIHNTHKNYLTKSYTQLSENAAAYAPYRQLFVSIFSPEILKLYIQQLQLWSEGQHWLSDKTLINVVKYLAAMVDFKKVFGEIIEPQLSGLIGQVFFPLMCPTEDDIDLFEDDPVEFVQRQADFNDVFLPSHVATDFIRHIVRKRKNTLPLVMEFLEQCANRLLNERDAIKERVGLFTLIQALESVFLTKGSPYSSSLEPALVQYVIPDLISPHAYLRNEACNTINRMAAYHFHSRDTIQTIFHGVLQCFFDKMNLPVQVAAAQALQSLSSEDLNQDVRAALKQHITEVIQNLLEITQKIDLESLLNVLDHFVGQFPDQITPFAVELAAQLCQQFMNVGSELAEIQRHIDESGGGAVSESEVFSMTSEKTNAGYGIMNSLANLQNNLEHQRDLTARLDEVIAPVFLAVYQHELLDFYPDCLSLHENTLFTLKAVPSHHWQYFNMLIDIIKKSKFDYFEDAMPVLENYILYGSTYLAENQTLLAKFTELLVSFYSPRDNTGYDEAAPLFTDARTRAHVMSVATKLMVCSGLFNGPLYPYISNIIDSVLSRVSADSQNTSASFPPRYNVATVSVVLSGLYHDPERTLLVLDSRGAVDSFFETWFETLTEFTRVNDLKLCVVSILSLLTYQTTHPQYKLGAIPQLLKGLVHCLGALPGAASRVAELMKDDEAGLWDDDADFDEFDELDGEGDSDDENAGGNDASAEFGDQMPETSVASGTGNFMYEQPGTVDANVTEGKNDETPEELRSTLVSQMGFISDDFAEDMYSVSPLDGLNPYDALRTVFSVLQSSQPEFYKQLMSSFSESDMAIINESLQRAGLPEYTH